MARELPEANRCSCGHFFYTQHMSVGPCMEGCAKGKCELWQAADAYDALKRRGLGEEHLAKPPIVEPFIMTEGLRSGALIALERGLGESAFVTDSDPTK